MKKSARSSVFTFLGLLAFAILLVAPAVSALTVQQVVFDPVYAMFAEWGDGDLSVNIAQYLLLILLTLLLYSILDSVPFFDGKGGGKVTIRIISAFIIAFLGIAYLGGGDIYTILASYGALAFVLSAALPFIILAFFSIKIRKEGKAMGVMLSKVLWVAFIGFLIYKLVDGMFGTQVIGQIEGWLYIAAIVGVILWLWFLEKSFVKHLFKEEFDQSVDKYKKQLSAQDAKRKADAASIVPDMNG